MYFPPNESELETEKRNDADPERKISKYIKKKQSAKRKKQITRTRQ